jgi:type II secretory pathway component PulC
MAMNKANGWRIASLALWALAALLALHLAWGLRPAGPEKRAAAKAAAPEPEDFHWPQLDASIWRLFRSGGPVAPPPGPGALAARYRLAGAFLVLSEDGYRPDGSRCAILDDLQEQQQHLAMEGEWIGSVRVVRVESDHVVLSDGEREEVVVLAAGTLPGRERPGPAGAPPAAPPAVLDSNRFGNRIGDTRWEVNRDAVMGYYQEMMDNPERLASLFLAMRADRDAEGRVDGYQLDMTFGEKDFYEQVGFQNGDVIRKANSMRMTSQRRAEYFIGEFVQGRLDTVVIDIERNGEPKKLIYLVK